MSGWLRSLILRVASRGLACAIGFGVGCFAQAQTVEEVPLRPPVVSLQYPPPEQISYRQNGMDDRGFNRLVSEIAVPTLTIYRPIRTEHRGASIVICPGGAYHAVVIDREGHQIARYFQARGITAVVLKYRLPKPQLTGDDLPWSQQDALAAIQYVRQHAFAWGCDPARLGIMGFSAGGHLAGSAAILGEATTGSRPDFVALLYPVVTLEAPYAHEGSRKNLLGEAARAERVKAYSLEQQARAGLPPHFIAHARDDNIVPYQNSELLAAALEKAEVPAELSLFATGGHGFTLGRGEESARWKEAFLRWLDALP